MANLILVGGLALTVALAAVMIRPAWRLPALVLAFLAIPGNVDNLVPQMSLDPFVRRSATAPMISVVDVLIAWAAILTIRERLTLDRTGRLIVLGGAVLAVLATLTSLAALTRGVDAPAVVRGIIVFVRIPVLLWLAVALRDRLREPLPLVAALGLGGAALLANGIYQTLTTEADRFTAATFGRNGLAIALTLVVIAVAGGVFAVWGSRDRRPWLAIAGAAVALAGIFGAVATGTRMGLLVLLAAGVAALLLHPGRLDRGTIARAAVVAVAVLATIGSAVALTSAGLRTVSIVTDPGDAVDIVTDPGAVPDYSAVRSRTQFWQMAVEMARAEPLTGVGPFQWNVERYELDPTSRRVVADAHNTYLQIGAEYGIPVMAAYVLLVAAIALIAILALLRRDGRRSIGWTGLGLIVAAGVYPIAELTNSHLFNVRQGAFGWLLLGTAVAIAAVARESVLARDRTATDVRPVPREHASRAGS